MGSAVLTLLLMAPSGLEASTRKGDKFFKLGQKAESKKDWDGALGNYERALSQDPNDIGYMAAVRRIRFQAGQGHVDKGRRLREQGQLPEALTEFQRAFSVDPSSTIALEEIKTTQEMIEQGKKPGGSGEVLTPMQELNQKTMARIESLQPVPELKPINRRITNLKMNAQPARVLYETVGKLAGVNVIIDPAYTANAKGANVDLSNATLEEALDYVAMVTHTFWKPITSNTIFVAEENPTKRRDYEDQVVKVFYLKNVTTPQEFQEIVTAVRSVTDIRRIFTYNEQNAAVVRGSTDQVALAEKLFHDLDKPKAEVVVDIMVMSTNTSRIRDLASTIVSSAGNGISVPIAFTPRASISVPNSAASGLSGLVNNGTTGGTGTTGLTGGTGLTGTGVAGAGLTGLTGTTGSIPVSNIQHVSTSDFSAILPGALLEAMLQDNSTKVLQSPEVRASDGMKVTLKIGQKYPYATGSFQPGVGTVGVSPLVSTQFQFLDTGIDLELQPHVHGSDEVSMHIDFKLSNVAQTLNLGGLQQPVVAQETNATDVRVRDGQVTLLGGLMGTTDTLNVSGIPGLMNIPVLGQFFGSQNHKEVDHQDLVIAVIPHIVRTTDLTALDLRGVYAGTDQTIRVIRMDAGEVAGQAAAQAVPAALVAPAAGVPAVVAPALPGPVSTAPGAAAPVPAGPVPAGPGAAHPAAVPGAAGPAGGAGPAAGPMKLSFAPAAVTVKAGAAVAVTLQVEGAKDLFTSPVHLRWDPKLLAMMTATPGTMLTLGGQAVNAPAEIHNDKGEAVVTLARLPGAGGVNGSGAAAILNFVAIGKGTATVSIIEVNAKNSKMEHLDASTTELKVTVQ